VTDPDPRHTRDQEADPHLGEDVLARAVAAYEAALGSRLIAGYALGSLAHGGFSPLVSDVDLGLVLQDPVRAKDRVTIRTVARPSHAELLVAGAEFAPYRIARRTTVTLSLADCRNTINVRLAAQEGGRPRRR